MSKKEFHNVINRKMTAEEEEEMNAELVRQYELTKGDIDYFDPYDCPNRY
ncbi:hypothetical protein [Psychrobacillus sp. L3]